ncbi:Bax inhibitor-1/YccA family protein [Frigoribacterium sp. PhB116]|uniref:Bax inhibitor-1/YccA family protein n=1 Tax=Frigoribacterium sp. PhB116 TaxID=2485174 RepID=UPI00105BDF68|nr:Bax inhibitor-1/YccA family protein [Frigoribacterium sp. PhB116]TDT64042.1 putative YccA/Bax inhibitor family protein [Frigoribacterium sp. PhB116]
MAFSNPGFSQSPAFSEKGAAVIRQERAAAGQRPVEYNGMTAEQLQDLYTQPAAGPVETDRMTYEDTIVKTVIAFSLVAVGAAIGWFIPALAFVGAIAGFVLALVNIFKKRPSAGLVLAYSAAQGLFVGGISAIFEQIYPGIAVQALLGTGSVFVVTLLLFRSGKVRESAKATKIFMVAMVGYALFSLVNLGLVAFGVSSEPFGLRSADIPGTNIPIGVALGVLVILMAAYSLVLDFTNIKTGVERGAPRIYGWSAAFGLVMTVVWLYVEILRLLAILRGND